MIFPANIDGAIILSPSNLFYFTGYSNADAAILLTKEENFYITDKRCFEEAEAVIKGFKIVDSEGSAYAEKAAELLSRSGGASVGVEYDEISYKNYLSIEKYFKNICSVSDLIGELRAVKNATELQKIRSAQAVTDKIYEKVLEIVKPGKFTELGLQAAIDMMIVSAGGTPAFETIVAFGENTSKPHCHPGDRILKNGDVVTIDFGAKLNGYCSDMTRSFAVGVAPEGYKEVYEAVLNAKNISEDKIKAGMTGKECDAVARNYLTEKGFGQYFTHSLGHSLGIDIHESPNLSPRCDKKIPEGAVTSVEPGVYLPGKFGVRIEDIVLFKNSGVENLTNSPENLIIV